MKKLTFLLFIFSATIFFGQNENYTIKNIVANKEFQDFGVSYFGNSLAVFASARKNVFMKRVWSGNHEPFLRLYRGTVGLDGQINNVRPFGNKIETKYHESNLTFTNDFKTVYFSRNNYYHKEYRTNKEGVNLIQIYKAKIDSLGKWTNIERLPFNSDQFSSGHPALNKDNTALYFVSDRPGSFGETDIYKVAINADGTYGEPVNLGEKVNTSKKEMFPFIDENGILYFSSEGFIDSKGKLDIYATKLKPNGKYYTPVNLGFPINSKQDDFAFVKQKGKKTGHFSSNRNGGKGGDDIYAYTELKEPYFDCPETIQGVVVNSTNNKELALAKVTLYHNNEELRSIITDQQGRYHFNVQCRSHYKIIVSKKHFKQEVIEVDSKNIGLLEVDFSLTPEENKHFIKTNNNVMLNIEPIYFDYGKATLKPISEKELQLVVDIMNKYPEIIIQIRAHTDSRGKDNFNYVLSDKRANTAMRWIIKKGISKNRIMAIGFGEEGLINHCKNGIKCSEEEHLENRRTEFIILNPSIVGH